ncbi:MAG: hypothetical protein LW808_001780 [Verrucomicrobiota bacterium]|nr:MAG: hypothetical protein LW808_001780 [Verrucomicrobiota bacterium]
MEVTKIGGEGRTVTMGPPVYGKYRGQAVSNVLVNTESITQLASQIAGYEAVRQRQRPDLLARKVESKKIFRAKEKVLAEYTERLGQRSQSKRYKETYAEFNRWQYKEEFEENPEKLRDEILYKVAGNFGEVTEQDNLLEYAIATNEIDREHLEGAVVQTKNMIAYYNAPEKYRLDLGFANTERLRWEKKLQTLETNLKSNTLLKEQLQQAQVELRKIHRQEIRDGYNLIPKAAAIAMQFGDDSGDTAISLAIAYRDEILTIKNPLDVFEIFIKRQEQKRERFRPYIDSMIALFGYDMSSANPSRSREELSGVRDSLYRVEICGQVYDSVGDVYAGIQHLFPEVQEPLAHKTQVDATRSLVQMTQGAFPSIQQMTNFLILLCARCKTDLDIAIYTLNQTIELVRDLPEKFFKDDQSQGQFLKTAQKKLDEYILQEEEMAGAAYLEGK